MERIYLDNAATTPLQTEVLNAMLPYFTQVYGNADSPHASGRKAMSAVDTARDTVAELLGASAKEIYFTSGGTESDNWALFGVAKALQKQGKTKIILSSIEHHACLFSAERLQKDGFEVVYLPVNQGGRVEINALKEAMDSTVALVCVMASNNETGVLQPIKECAEIAHKHGAYFFTDAVQLAPHRKIQVKELGVDLLSISAHKFHGPKGVGALYIRSGVKIEPLVGGGEQERGLRGGTLNVAGIVGLASAYEIAVKNAERTEEYIGELNKLFLDGLSGLEGVEINGACFFFVKSLIENIQSNILGKRIATLCAVFVFPAFPSGIMFRPCRHFRVTQSAIFLVFCAVLFRLRRVDNRFADETFKNTCVLGGTDKACNMVQITVRDDNEFQHPVRAVVLDIRYERTCRTFHATCVDKHFRIARFN